ncbi:AraC family transcriptional regulator [Rhodococcus oryzae]|uniref:AraC family transcriptional regulator n=1 Tax=Rhodococcus oryzae TaxID=2571143 RepID=A0ABY2REV9_9NOCA|nr:helix-turn-helix domain-containing protein [Rhodococcus oryzae]TJZ73423.1 AraC family transcriptional regulator [Rhodococcus oryzae]
MTGHSEGRRASPAQALRPFVGPYEGYRLTGFEPGSHLGLPSPYLTVIIALDAPLELARMSDPRQQPGAWGTLASGLSTAPVTIRHDGNQHGVQLALTPAGSRALLGVPAAELGAWVVELEDLLGTDSEELSDRIAAQPSWEARFAVLDEVLSRRLADAEIDPHLEHAWQLLTAAEGVVRVGQVAREIGWSRRHLVGRFAAEFGVSPKEAAKLARFHRSHQLLRSRPSISLADAAARCGFYDQAHLARDWRDIVGIPPSRWRAEELFSFIQADQTSEGAVSRA